MNFKEHFEPKKIELLCGKIFPLVFIATLTICAFINFIIKYGMSPKFAVASFNKNPLFLQNIFYIDFYVFFAVLILAMAILIFAKGFYFKAGAIFLGTAAASLIVYVSNDFFNIKFFIYCAWLFTVIITIRWKLNFLVAIISIISFYVCQYHPNFLGKLEADFPNIENNNPKIALIYLILITAISIVYKFCNEHWLDSERRAEHINMVMTQMSLLNRQLQDFAKTRGKKAVEQERLRITRDLHDSCGYIFVNLTSMMDAAISRPNITTEEIEEIFLTVRNMAVSGLQQTRKTLHEIRNLQEGPEKNLSAIFDIKNIFNHITGINIEIQTGNIQQDYGPTVNHIIVRTMQESLTNAIRHGNAKNIYISFWQENDVLTMNVKDDGIGAEKIVKGIGLAGMEERLSKQGGTLEISLPKEGGFRITANIPLTIKDKNSETEDENYGRKD